MKAVSLLYHEPDLLEVDLEEMRRHFQAMEAARGGDKPVRVTDLLDGDTTELPWLLTFDQGGVNAPRIADLLDEFGWIGHFFVTAGRVGTPEVVSEEQIRDLHKRGHVIGTHSWSQPERMSQFVRVEMIEEWRKSMEFLAQITGEPVVTASIPQGDYSAEVAGTAGQCGIRAIFTSEPVKEGWPVGACMALGRYSLQGGDPLEDVSGLVAGDRSKQQLRQYLRWKARKTLKTFGGNAYLAVRERILAARGRD